MAADGKFDDTRTDDEVIAVGKFGLATAMEATREMLRRAQGHPAEADIQEVLKLLAGAHSKATAIGKTYGGDVSVKFGST